MPNNFLPAVYDARNNKFYGDRPDGTLAYVDPNPKTRNVSSTSSQYPAYAMVTTADVGNIIEVDSPAGKHSLVYLPDSTDTNIVPNDYPTNSEIQVVNIGPGTLEILAYAYNFDVKSANGAQLTGQYAEAKLRCRGENDWFVNGEVGQTNAKRYSVVNNASGSYEFTGEGLTSSPNPSLTLMMDQELILTINASGHPLWIKDTQSTGAGSTSNVQTWGSFDENGAETGILRFRPWKAGTYYYNCQYHSSMKGSITVTNT